MPIKSYAEAIREATDQLLAEDRSVLLIGEGVLDKAGIFGTTTGLKQKYPDRVFDSPISENGVVGACVGAAVGGNMKPIMVFQRCDFSLLALDQIANNAAKWYSIFGKPCNITLRLVVGRGWGNGPTHTFDASSLFSMFPGLKVVAPASAHDAKGLLISAVRDPNPVIFIENRWLHNIKEDVPDELYETTSNATVRRIGSDVTVVSLSYSTIEALKAQELLKPFNIQPEIIDLITCSPVDLETIATSVRKTGKLVVVADKFIGAEVVRQVTENYFNVLKTAPKVLGTKDYPCPTSNFLTEDYYADDVDITNECLRMCNSSERIEKTPKKDHDIFPGFLGPF